MRQQTHEAKLVEIDKGGVSCKINQLGSIIKKAHNKARRGFGPMKDFYFYLLCFPNWVLRRKGSVERRSLECPI